MSVTTQQIQAMIAQSVQQQVAAATRGPGVANNPQYMWRDFFTYEIDLTSTIAASGSATATFQIQTDSDFLWTKAAFIQTGTGVPAILIQDTGSGRNLSSYAVPVANIFGTGQLPFILPRQRIFAANATVNLTVSEIGGTNTITSLHLSFIGEKGFKGQ
ncbi:MAG: hypothetical protein ACYDHF_07950 [Candidatus Cryosericum sp.]